MTFSQQSAWSFVRSRLQPDTIVRNWTARMGYIRGDFIIHEIRSQGVKVELIPQGSVVSVSAADFETIGQRWSAYLDGGVDRATLRDRSRGTKYVISILHQLGYQQPD